MESVGIEPKRSPCKGVDLPLASAPYILRRAEYSKLIPESTTRLAGGDSTLAVSLSIICGRRGNRTPKALRPTRFQDGLLVHSDSFQLSKWQGSNLRSLHPKCSGIPTFLHLVIVGVVGLEPTKTNVGGFTVPCNCRYAILPNSLKTKNPEILWSQGSSLLVNIIVTNLST